MNVDRLCQRQKTRKSPVDISQRHSMSVYMFSSFENRFVFEKQGHCDKRPDLQRAY